MQINPKKESGLIAQEVAKTFPELTYNTGLFLNNKKDEDRIYKRPSYTEEEVVDEKTGKTTIKKVHKSYPAPDTDLLGVNYGGFVPHLISAIQQQQKLIVNLTERVKMLEKDKSTETTSRAPRALREDDEKLITKLSKRIAELEKGQKAPVEAPRVRKEKEAAMEALIAKMGAMEARLAELEAPAK